MGVVLPDSSSDSESSFNLKPRVRLRPTESSDSEKFKFKFQVKRLRSGPARRAPTRRGSEAESSDSDSRHSVMEISGKERRPPPGNTSCKAASRCWSGRRVHGNRSERDGIALRDRLLGRYIKRVQAATNFAYCGQIGTEFAQSQIRLKTNRSADPK